MKARCLMGVENEHGICGPDDEIKTELALQCIQQLYEMSQGLWDITGKGVVLPNGIRIYVDHGLKLEVSCPPVQNPYDLVCYEDAGERILQSAYASVLSGRPRFHQTWMTKTNLDYAGQTHGSHESYQHKIANNQELSDIMVPHLCSRCVYTGGGGFNPYHPGLKMVMSPRAFFMEDTLSGSSTERRPLFHVRDESLSKPGFHRMHVITGDSNGSQVSLLLRFGVTALILACAEKGCFRQGWIELTDPLDAIKKFSSDMKLSTTVSTLGGRWLSALEIQRLYLEAVQDHMDDLPDWAPEICSLWEKTLDQLETPDRDLLPLDWVAKKRIYDDVIAQSGFDQQSIAHMSSIASTIATQMETDDVRLQVIMGGNQPAAAVLSSCSNLLNSIGRNWNDYDEFLELRRKLFMLDVQWGEVSNGIYQRLKRAGVLEDHKVTTEAGIEAALNHAPAFGRDKVREGLIRRFSPTEREDYRCAWTYVLNQKNQNVLELTDPYETEEHWGPAPQEVLGSHLLRFGEGRRLRPPRTQTNQAAETRVPF